MTIHRDNLCRLAAIDTASGEMRCEGGGVRVLTRDKAVTPEKGPCCSAGKEAARHES